MAKKSPLADVVRSKNREQVRLGRVDIPNILEFFESDWGLNREGNLKLYPVQTFILKMFYNIPLEAEKKTIEIKDMFNERVEQTMTEVEYLEYLHGQGRCNIGKQDFKERRTLILPIGRRSGKSFLSSVIAAYETYRLLHLVDPLAHYGLAPGIPISIVTLASEKEQAGIIFAATQNHYLSVPFFKQYKANDTLSYVSFQTAKDVELGGRWNPGRNSNAPTSIKATFKASNSSGIRGFNNLVVILDEFAHFKDATKKSNSALIWDAVTPSTATFSPKDPADLHKPIATSDGRTIVISSPWVRSGKFYELFDQAFRGDEGGGDFLVIQAPTWEVNTTIDSAYLRSKYYGGPDSFMIEFGANFADNVRGWIERDEDLLSCVHPEWFPQTRGLQRHTYYLGIDLGVTKGGDGSSFTLSHLDPNYNVIIDYHEAVYAGIPLPGEVKDLFPTSDDWAVDADRLDFDDLAKWAYYLSRRFRIAEGMFDQWMGIAFEQILIKRYGLSKIKMKKIKPTEHSDMYQTFKVLMYDQRVVLPTLPIVKNGKSALVSELLDLEAEFRSRNVIDVHAPDIKGYHDDRSDSLVRSVYMAAQRMQKTKKAAPPMLPSGMRFNRDDAVRHQMRNMRRTGMMPQRGKRLSMIKRMNKRR